jgi:hypothetical protein
MRRRRKAGVPKEVENVRTLEQLLADARAKKAQLAQEHHSRESDAAFDGVEPNRHTIEASYYGASEAAKDEANAAVVSAKEAVVAAIAVHRRSPAISRRLRVLFGRHRQLCIQNLPVGVLQAFQAYRAAVDLRKEAKAEYAAMILNVAAGPLSEQINRKFEEISYKHLLSSLLRDTAVSERTKIADEHRRLALAIDWLSNDGRRFKMDRPLTEAAAIAVVDWMKADGDLGRASKPVVRITPDVADMDDFRRTAETITAAWLEQVPSIGHTVTANPEVVRNMAAKIGVSSAQGADGFSVLHSLWKALEKPQSFAPDVKALLYWIASAAEVAMIGELTAKTDEEPSTTLLLSNLTESSEEIGKPLFRALGYGKDFPFHIVTYATGKATEAEVGADFGIILSLGLDDRMLCRAALVQSKLASRDQANIHRDSEARGNMHQLAALTRVPRSGYYFFLDKDPVTGPPAAVVSADTIAQRLLKQHGVSSITDLAYKQCNVKCSSEAVDFGTFFGFTMLEEGLKCSSILDAIKMVGGHEEHRIAAKLMIIQVGQSLLEPEIKAELERLGYRPSRTQWTIAQMARHLRDKGHGF